MIIVLVMATRGTCPIEIKMGQHWFDSGLISAHCGMLMGRTCTIYVGYAATQMATRGSLGFTCTLDPGTRVLPGQTGLEYYYCEQIDPPATKKPRGSPTPPLLSITQYSQISDISCTKSLNLKFLATSCSCLCNILKQGVKSRMKI